MSIASELSHLTLNKSAIKAAIEAKLPSIPPTDSLSQWPKSIMSIPNGDGWKKPVDWPDIESILKNDVTPPSAIEAGATNKWITLYRKGMIGNGATSILFDSPAVYLRISDGVTTNEQSASSGVSPLSGDGYYWVIVYSSSANFTIPRPGWWNIPEFALCWIHAPDMTLVDGGNMLLRKSLLRVKASEFGGWPDNLPMGYRVGCNSLESFECGRLSTGTKSCEGLFQSGYGDPYRSVSLRHVDVSQWDVSSVMNMKSMFEFCYSLRTLDVSRWDVSSVTTMEYMFSNCHSLSKLDVSRWDVSSVTNMAYMFRYCYPLRKLDVYSWDVSSVTDMKHMFNNCQSLVYLDVSRWDVGSVTNMNSMFGSCYTLTHLDMSSWDVGSVTDMTYMFSNCTSLISLIGNKTVSTDGSINGSTAYFEKGPNVAFAVNSSNNLNHDSLLFLMYWVVDRSETTPLTLTLGATNLAKLTTEEKAIATSKNWTLS